MSARTLVLGGGFGGIAAALELRRLAGDDAEVVLVDRKPRFTMGLRKLWELVGHGTIAEGSRSRALLARHGVEFVEAELTAIDPVGRRAKTADGWLEGDRLVIAVGAVVGRTWETHTNSSAPSSTGTHIRKSANDRSASSCHSATTSCR